MDSDPDPDPDVSNHITEINRLREKTREDNERRYERNDYDKCGKKYTNQKNQGKMINIMNNSRNFDEDDDDKFNILNLKVDSFVRKTKEDQKKPKTAKAKTAKAKTAKAKTAKTKMAKAKTAKTAKTKTAKAKTAKAKSAKAKSKK